MKAGEGIIAAATAVYVIWKVESESGSSRFYYLMFMAAGKRSLFEGDL